MRGRIASLCHTQRCPGYLWKSRQWHPSCRRKQTLSASPGLLWLFFRPTQSPVGSGKAPRRFQSKEEASSPGKASPWWPNACPKSDSVLAHLSRTWERPGRGSRAPAAASRELLQDALPPRFLGSPASPGSSAASDTPSSAVSISLTPGSLQTPLQSSQRGLVWVLFHLCRTLTLEGWVLYCCYSWKSERSTSHGKRLLKSY